MSRQRPFTRHLLALSLPAVLAVGLTGCAGSDDEQEAAADAVEGADEAVVTDPEGGADVEVDDTGDLAVVEGSEEAAAALADAVAATRQSNVRVAFTSNAATAAASDTVTGAGTADGGDLQVDLDVSGSLAEAYGVMDTEVEVRVVGDDVYLRFPALLAAADVDAEWLRTSLDQVDGDPGDLIERALLVDPAEALALLESPTAVADLGEEFVEGEPTTHYLATVELGAALEATGIGSDLFSDIEADPDRLIEVHAYVGDDGLVRRMEARMDKDGAELELVVDVLEVDVDAEVEAPPAEDVITFEELVAARGG